MHLSRVAVGITIHAGTHEEARGGDDRRASLETLTASFAGELVQPQDAGFDAARQLWNGHVQRWPALIARCRGAADVMAAVGFCRDHDLPASVWGGGHAVAGHATSEGGVVIDLSVMTGSRVDPLARTIQLQGGCLNAHLDRERQAFGLAATGGIVSHTGTRGLTLDGGLGHLIREFGLAIGGLRSCDVVTAEGDLVVTSEQEHPRPVLGAAGREAATSASSPASRSPARLPPDPRHRRRQSA